MLAPANVPRDWLAVATLRFSLVLSMLMFYLGYRFVPVRRMRAGPGARGRHRRRRCCGRSPSSSSALYIREFGVYDQIYGPLGVLVAFVMFVYYSAIVFVVGGAYAASLDARAPASADRGPRVARCLTRGASVGDAALTCAEAWARVSRLGTGGSRWC